MTFWLLVRARAAKGPVLCCKSTPVKEQNMVAVPVPLPLALIFALMTPSQNVPVVVGSLPVCCFSVRLFLSA